MTKLKVSNAFLLITLFVASMSVANSQSTVWNAPSTDVLTRGKLYAEVDFFSHFGSPDKGGFRTYGNRLVYGPAKKLEVGLNTFYTKAGDAPIPVEVQPNFKYQYFNHEGKGVAASFGGMVYIPVNNRAGSDTFGMFYSTVSKKLSLEYGPRFTGGVYGLVGRTSNAGIRGGAIVGFEQPIHRRVTFIGDWYSGKNRFGYAGGGLAFTVSKKSLFFVGYNVGNQGRGNNYLSAFYGYSF